MATPPIARGSSAATTLPNTTSNASEGDRYGEGLGDGQVVGDLLVDLLVGQRKAAGTNADAVPGARQRLASAPARLGARLSLPSTCAVTSAERPSLLTKPASAPPRSSPVRSHAAHVGLTGEIPARPKPTERAAGLLAPAGPCNKNTRFGSP